MVLRCSIVNIFHISYLNPYIKVKTRRMHPEAVEVSAHNALFME